MKGIRDFTLVIIRVITGYYVMKVAISLLYRIFNPTYEVKLYIKETFHLDQKRIQRLKIFSQFAFGILSTLIITFIILQNFPPFGAVYYYSLGDKKKFISDLGPNDRVQKITIKGSSIYKQVDDLIYFSTKMPFQFDKAEVRIVYQNINPDQPVYLGFSDESSWHYDTELVDSPILNSVSWSRVGTGPILYQREKRYKNIDSFLNNPPKDGVTGTFNIDISQFSKFTTLIPKYKSQSKKTTINLPLRGKHTLYTYLKNEPFEMKITKQDLNWYTGSDLASVNVYKDGVLVYKQDFPDDGNETDNRQVGDLQEITIRNPGPGLPEPGVYKVELDASQDSVINKIETNLHKIVFEGQVYPINSNNVYPGIVSSSSATTLFTNALTLTAETYHTQSQQSIFINNQVLKVDAPNVEYQLAPKNIYSTIVIPKNDVILRGLFGYFAVEESQFFIPTSSFVIPIKSKEDIGLLDYIFTDYSMPKSLDGWSVISKTFDISNANIKDGYLSWLIKAPGLKKSNKSILIKDIEVTLSKEAIIDLNKLKLRV